MSDVANGGPKLGTTIYSFTREYHGRTATMEDLIRRVAAEGIGPGLELVGFQSFRGWPTLDTETINRFRALIDETGLTPSCMGANSDLGLRSDRDLTPAELVDYSEAQIVTAAKLGFPTIRLQYSATPDDMERLLPIAERENVSLGIEVHAHHSPRHPLFQALRERYERLGSPRLGFIPDWGTSMVRVPPSILREFASRGVPQESLDAIRDEFERLLATGPVMVDHTIPDLFARFYSLLPADPQVHKAANMLVISAVGLFGRAAPIDWEIVAPWTVHMHGKFYEIDDEGNEPAVPTRDILRVFVDAGYEGYISSEYEGWHWNRTGDATEMVRRHHALERRLIDELTAARR